MWLGVFIDGNWIDRTGCHNNHCIVCDWIQQKGPWMAFIRSIVYSCVFLYYITIRQHKAYSDNWKIMLFFTWQVSNDVACRISKDTRYPSPRILLTKPWNTKHHSTESILLDRRDIYFTFGHLHDTRHHSFLVTFTWRINIWCVFSVWVELASTHESLWRETARRIKGGRKCKTYCWWNKSCTNWGWQFIPLFTTVL